MRLDGTFLLFLFSLIFLSTQAYSQISGDFSEGGAVVVGDSTTTCDTNASGAIRFNNTTKQMEYCNETAWTSVGGGGGGTPECTNDSTEACILEATRANDDPQFTAANIADGVSILGVTGTLAAGCTPDPTCPNVGDVCSGDGTGGGNPKFAGCITYFDSNSTDTGITKAIYVTQANQSSSMWKTSPSGPDITTRSAEDGKINDSQIPNSTTFPAFKACKDLTAGGYTDWYLPALMELYLLGVNSASISGLPSGYYWSSNEELSDSLGRYAVYLQFGGGGYAAQGTMSKNNSFAVRCVRRD